ncbi:MAG: DMT family transporter [Cyclobacteriaceae bacterium]|nr:EamA family transporter [Cyclobacteriaceae bacterium]MCH8516427.1 DMT family transporter [Cyclobacteriaceae bacterium]
MIQEAVKDQLKLHFIVLLWGSTAVIGVLMTLDSVEITFYRTAIASVLLGGLLAIRKRKFNLGSRTIALLLANGIIIAFHWILFFAAARLSTVSVTLAVMATCALFTSFLEPLFTKSKIKKVEVFLGLVVLVGLIIIFKVEFQYALGIGLALISAFLAALFTVINGKFAKVHNAYMITFWEMIGAAITCILIFPLFDTTLGDGDGFQWITNNHDWIYIFILAGVCTVYAYSVAVELMQRLSAFNINLTINLEPVYGIILALIIFGEKEQMNTEFYFGALLIIGAVLFYPMWNKFRQKRMRKKSISFIKKANS